MRGTVKFFDKVKGWGFITDSDGKDVFVHWTNIVMDRFRYLDEDDIVNFELGDGGDGREQAISVIPVLTRKRIEESLKENNLYVKEVKANSDTVRLNTLGMDDGYMVIDENGVIQAGENGMTFLDLAAYAGFEVHQVSA